MSELLDAALEYAARSWPVFPVAPAGKVPLISKAQGGRGLHDATCDEEIIQRWWHREPKANIGLRTGVAFDVLDVDGQQGRDALTEAVAELGSALPSGPWSRTGGGGDHLLFTPTGGGNRAGILPKVDWRGDGGYIVAPPSVHPTGEHYRWEQGPDTPLAAVPNWLEAIVNPPRIERASGPVKFLPGSAGDGTPYGLQALDAELAELARSQEGERNHTLNACAFSLYQLVAGGELRENVVEERLRTVGLSVGLPEREVVTTLGSARSKGMQQPRSAPELSIIGNLALAPRATPIEGEEAEPQRRELDPVVDLRRAFLKSRLLDADGVETLPPPEPLVNEVLMRNTLSVVYGKPGSGKSFVVTDVALSVATGSWWFGREVRAGTVLYVVAEGTAGLAQRKRAWQQARQTWEIPNMWWLPVAVNLIDAKWAAAFVELVRELRPALVVIDTLARSMVGGDENAAKDMSTVIEVVDRAREASDAHVLVVHHTPKDGGSIRGHSALEGAADTTIEVKADGATTTLRCEKQKDAARFEPIRLYRRVVGDSCALYSQAERGSSDELSESEDHLLRVMWESVGSEGLGASALMRVALMPESSFYRALKNLRDQGLVTNAGSDKAPKWAPKGGPPPEDEF